MWRKSHVSGLIIMRSKRVGEWIVFVPFSRVACVACDKNGQTLICIYSEWSHAKHHALQSRIALCTLRMKCVCPSWGRIRLRENEKKRLRTTKILIIFPSNLMARKTMDRSLTTITLAPSFLRLKGKICWLFKKLKWNAHNYYWKI